MSAPFAPWQPSPPPAVATNGHDPALPGRLMPGPAPAGAGPDEAELLVVRFIRRRVAEALTGETRAYERRHGFRMPPGEREEVTRRLLDQALDGYADELISAGRPPLSPQVESRVLRTVADSLLAAGGLQPLLDRDDVEDIIANGADVVFVRVAGGGWEPAAPIAESDEELVELVRLLAARNDTGEERRFDRASPTLNLQLPDGSRLNAVMSVSKRPSVAIRRHRYRTMTMAELVQLGTLDALSAALLTAAVKARMNIVVAGKTGVGKTTFLRGLVSVVPALERIITLEDTYELGFELYPQAHANVVAMQAREPNLEGEGGVSLTVLFRNGLRMLPDRVLVGEVRGDEVVPMLQAMSQGNDGSMSTIHASSSAGVFRKLALYAAQAPERLDTATTNMHIAEGVDLVVHLGEVDGRRVLTSVREVVDADGLQVMTNEILRPTPHGPAGPGAPPSHNLLTRLAAHGFDPDLLRRPYDEPGWVA